MYVCPPAMYLVVLDEFVIVREGVGAGFVSNENISKGLTVICDDNVNLKKGSDKHDGIN